MYANACGLEFESFCGIVGEGCGDFSCSVCEWDVFVYEGDEATTTPRVLSCLRLFDSETWV